MKSRPCTVPAEQRGLHIQFLAPQSSEIGQRPRLESRELFVTSQSDKARGESSIALAIPEGVFTAWRATVAEDA